MQLPLKPKEGREIHMKKQALKTFTMLNLLMLTAVSVAAQSERIRVINISFSFIVGDKTLPAGEYTVEPNRKDSDNDACASQRDARGSQASLPSVW
jgi:hypothetical protein